MLLTSALTNPDGNSGRRSCTGKQPNRCGRAGLLKLSLVNTQRVKNRIKSRSNRKAGISNEPMKVARVKPGGDENIRIAPTHFSRISDSSSSIRIQARRVN